MKLVGDRYNLVARQRTAVSRCCCPESQAAGRRQHEVGSEQLPGAVLWLDGYNVLTTIEAALAGGVILTGRDGAYRDMASMHGSYRKVAETRPALKLLGRTLAALGVSDCRWLLDRPVSNSGRLKGIIEELAAARGWPWRVELVPNPDILLADPAMGVEAACVRVAVPPTTVGVAVELPPQHAELPPQQPSPPATVAATADSHVLDRCPAWFNLARETICRHVPSAMVVDLTGEPLTAA